MTDTSKIRRPLTAQEKLLYDSNREECCYISYVLRISTDRKVTEEDARKVFSSLYRKAPNLRMCIDEEDGAHYLKQMHEEKIDFKVLENADVYKTYHEIADEPAFNFSEGPLWKARLLPYSENQDLYVNETSSSDKELTKFSNVCHIVVLFSHAITDGYSCVRIMKTILTMVNTVLNGEDIDDTQQIGKLLDLNYERLMKEQIRHSFLADPALLEKRRQSFGAFPMETLFEKAYPVAPFLKPKTRCLVHVADEMTTKNFVSRCKKEGITVHTGFCALINLAIIKMLLEKGFNQESYKISSLHAADNRVYYKCHDEFGVGTGNLDFTYEISKNEILSDFWKAAKKSHLIFKEQHKYISGLEHEVIEEMTGFNPFVCLPKEGQASPSKHMGYYWTTNMRDVTSLLGDRGDHIQLEFMDRLTTMFLFPIIWMNTYNTFRGRFIHSLQYNSHLMDYITAKKYSDLLLQMFSEVCDS